jgi:hypothetical protein
MSELVGDDLASFPGCSCHQQQHETALVCLGRCSALAIKET